ncbi:MAG: thiol:disulfide interchange protein DsbA/DsbL [Gammaproteobacteria bacterium]|nr:thiol:disulfide interchange protein DsbA/DsbL [Gammaproteobacteria bacterium]MCP5195386.1 thiol:disulfide interchange protein DsbA/DsbL [Gammaproteobacteria bacterium]
MPNRFHRWLLILLACTLPLAVRAADPPFQEGKDYVRLSTPAPTSAPDKIEVIEMFWYGCPHCHDLEPLAQAWLKRKPENVVFTRIPVALGATWEPGARAYYAAEALGVLDKVHQALFDAFHQRRKLNDEDQLAAFFAEYGVDQTAFRNAYKSFQTETQLRRGNQLAQRYGVRGVPAVIVNGQYDVRSPRIFEVVDFLIAKEAGPQS